MIVVKMETLKYPLYQHQERAIAKMEEWEAHPHVGVKGGIIGLTMGLGKTALTLAYIMKHYKDEPTLVICGKSVLGVWEADIKKFFGDKLKYFILHEAYNKGIYGYDIDFLKQYHLVLSTYEAVRDVYVNSKVCNLRVQTGVGRRAIPLPHLVHLKDIPEGYRICFVDKNVNLTSSNKNAFYTYKWPRIICDEAQKFASTDSLLYKAMVALNAHSYFCLTGTPMMNYSTDLYSLFRFMGYRCESKEWNERTYKRDRLDRNVFCMNYEDAGIKLPELAIDTLELNLNKKEKQLYKIYAIALADALHKFKIGEVTFTAPLAMFTRLRQICVCSYMLTEKSKRNGKEAEITVDLPEHLQEYINKRNECVPYSTKIQCLLRLVDYILKDNPNNKILIFSSFLSALDAIAPFLAILGKPLIFDGSLSSEERNMMVEVFNNNPEYRILLCTYKAGAVGLNLTSANYVLLLEPWWNSATEQQAIARAHRIGQTRPVQVFSLIAKPSFETYLLTVQKRKEDEQQLFIQNKSDYKFDKRSISMELMEHIVNGLSFRDHMDVDVKM